MWFANLWLTCWLIASIKPAQNNASVGLSLLPGGSIRAGSVTAKRLIRFAWGVPDDQISGLSDWAENEFWSIEARPETPGRAEPDLVLARLRVRTLLAERFGLRVREDSVQGAILALTVARGGPRLPPPKYPEAGSHVSRSPWIIAGTSATMPMLANAIGERLGTTVEDRTGVTGQYDFVLFYRPGTPAEGAFPALPARDAIEMLPELGLKLERARGVLRRVIVERIERPSPD